MNYAAATFVYNEAVNLPIWINYYGRLFGHENLFVIDRSTDDGSTNNLGRVNVIRIKRDVFDEHAKTELMSSFHSSLTAVFDAVIITDCDEILVPDPAHFSDLCDYIDQMPGEYVNAMGVDIVHILTEEHPLDLNLPILPQRSFGRFHSPECKHLLSRVPVRWLPGLHSSNKPPQFDFRLINFHMKLMDYSNAVKRQKINQETIWSNQSLDQNYGAHHRYSLKQFVQQSFFVPIDLMNRQLISDFTFSDEISQMESRIVQDQSGNYRVPMDIAKMVRIPDRFNVAF